MISVVNFCFIYIESEKVALQGGGGGGEQTCRAVSSRALCANEAYARVAMDTGHDAISSAGSSSAVFTSLRQTSSTLSKDADA